MKSENNNSSKYTVGSLYAGIGGICLGFIKAGADILWANENDKYACITYRKNFNHILYEKDIWRLSPRNLKNVDILTAGFPCQPFSLAGYQKGFEDERGNHFYRILYFLQSIKPKAVFLENVKHLNGHDNGNTLSIITSELKKINYEVKIKIMNTSEYGNLPQNRERIFIVGFRNTRKGINPYIENFKFPSKTRLTRTVKRILERNAAEEKYYYREDKYNFIQLRDSVTDGNTFYQWRRIYVRENKNNLCPTLTANMGTGGHNVPIILDHNGIRKLTPRECFNFQGFPLRFKLPKDIPNSQLYKQAGNSVSIPVVRRIAKRIIKALKEGDSKYKH